MRDWVLDAGYLVLLALTLLLSACSGADGRGEIAGRVLRVSAVRLSDLQAGRPDAMRSLRGWVCAADTWKRVAIPLVMINQVEVWELPGDRR